MKQWMRGRGGVGLALALSAGVVLPAAAQFGGGGSGFGGGFGGGVFGGFGSGQRNSSRQRARENLKQLEAELALQRDNVRAVRARYEAGQIPVDEVRNAELELLRTEGQVAAARTEANREQRLENLNRYVDVDLQGATVRQAAQALSKASGIPVQVDEKVTNEARITVRGRGVPMSVLLDRLGSRANLMIAPSEDGKGVELQTWPALELEGERTIYKGPLAPWSTEWGTVPITGVYQSEPAPAGGGAEAPPGVAPGGSPPKTGSGRTAPSKAPAGSPGGSMMGSGYPGMGMPGMSGMPGMPGMGTGMEMTSAYPGSGTSIGVGNGSIVVAEPGVKDGQPGLWLTVYKLSGTSLLKIGTGFHKSGGTAAPARKPSRGGTMPGGGSPLGGFGAPGAPPAAGGGYGGSFPRPAGPEGLGGELSPPAAPGLPAGPPMNAVPVPGAGFPGAAPGAPGAPPPPGLPEGFGGFPAAPPAPAPGVRRTPGPTQPKPITAPRAPSKPGQLARPLTPPKTAPVAIPAGPYPKAPPRP